MNSTIQLINELYASDEASALTNRAARALESHTADDKRKALKLLREVRDDLRMRAAIDSRNVIPISDSIWSKINKLLD